MSTTPSKEAIQPFLAPLMTINAAMAAHRDVVEKALVKAFVAGLGVSVEGHNQKEYHLGYAQGQSAALDKIRKQLLDMAADKWKRKQDVEADQLRNLADSVNLR